MTKPTIRDLLDTMSDKTSCPCRQCHNKRAVQLAERVEAVLQLHAAPTASQAKYADLCLVCDDLWPCPTIRALEGENS